MKTFLILLLTPFLFACTASGQFSDFLFGENTTSTVETCTADGVCMQIELDGKLSTADMLAIAAQVAAARENSESEPDQPE